MFPQALDRARKIETLLRSVQNHVASARSKLADGGNSNIPALRLLEDLGIMVRDLSVFQRQLVQRLKESDHDLVTRMARDHAKLAKAIQDKILRLRIESPELRIAKDSIESLVTAASFLAQSLETESSKAMPESSRIGLNALRVQILEGIEEVFKILQTPMGDARRVEEVKKQLDFARAIAKQMELNGSGVRGDANGIERHLGFALERVQSLVDYGAGAAKAVTIVKRLVSIAKKLVSLAERSAKSMKTGIPEVDNLTKAIDRLAQTAKSADVDLLRTLFEGAAEFFFRVKQKPLQKEAEALMDDVRKKPTKALVASWIKRTERLIAQASALKPAQVRLFGDADYSLDEIKQDLKEALSLLRNME